MSLNRSDWEYMEKNRRESTSCDFLVIGTIVTMDDNNTVVENGAVVVSGDSIADIGFASDLARKYQVKKTIELPRGVVMPGLINAHSQIMPPAHSQPVNISHKVVSPEELNSTDEAVGRAAFPAIAQMLRTGTTSFCDMSVDAGEITPAVENYGIRYWPDDVLSDSTSTFAELEESFCTHEGKMVHCPCSSQNLASGLSPIPGLLSRNVKIGLGTGTDNKQNYDMFTVMDINSKLHKVQTLDPTVMTARQTLYMATRGGAEVLGVDHLLGSIEVGKKADLIVLDFDQPHLTPVYDIPSHLVYAARGSDVVHSIINGRIVMRDRQLISIDNAEIFRQISL